MAERLEAARAIGDPAYECYERWKTDGAEEDQQAGLRGLRGGLRILTNVPAEELRAGGSWLLDDDEVLVDRWVSAILDMELDR